MAAHESSMTAHPERDINPFSISARLLSPLLPSRVRQVPLRFNESDLPGYHTDSHPLLSIVMVRFSGDAGVVTGFVLLRYLNLTLSVTIYKYVLSSLFLKRGTFSLRLVTVNVAWSSNIPLALYSMRIISGVRTVKRAFPQITTASGLATGLLSDAEVFAVASISRATKQIIVFPFLKFKRNPCNKGFF